MKLSDITMNNSKDLIILELCGVPGCGKSTLLSYYIENFGKDNILQRSDLYTSNKIIRNIQIRIDLLIYRLFQQNKEKGVFKKLFDYYSDASIHSKVRIMDLYKRISKLFSQKRILLLEEGPIQYLSALSFDKLTDYNESIKEYWTLYKDVKYYVIYCSCDNETTINRINSRNKSAGFYSTTQENIEELLNIKRENIQNLIKWLDLDCVVFDMNSQIDINSDKLDELIKRINISL